ncbi:MAG: NAD(P)H-quinone oxidoreductase [Candidatus Puniceispirillales bacterium]
MALPQDMLTITITEPGGPDVLAAARAPLPTPGDDEVLVKVAAAGVNGPDLLQRRGLYPPPPGASPLMGLEVSGTVVAVGAAVDRWQPGDQLCALTNGGGYAEYVAINAGHCLPIPAGMTLQDAAGLPETFFTVWSNIFHGHSIAEGAVLLVHGGAGGIGATAIQMGAAMGLRVFATAGGAEACRFCTDLGAERAIDYRDEDFVEVLREEAKGADIILDIIGGDYIARNIKASRPDARIISLAFNQGSKVTVDLMPMMLKRLTLTGSTLRSRPPAFKAAIAAGLEERIWPLIAAGKITPVTWRTFPLAEAVAAHHCMEEAGKQGKILLISDNES